MRLFLTNQSPNFPSLLAALVGRPVTAYDKERLIRNVSTINLTTERTIDELKLDFLFDYMIFPRHIMTCLTQWGLEKRKMKVADTILQQVFLPPIPAFSQKIVFGVRINSIISTPERQGFSYETIEGHVEKGESVFTVEKEGQGLIFKIETFSEPGNWLSKLVGPVFSIPYQRYCTRMALENVKGLVAGKEYT